MRKRIVIMSHRTGFRQALRQLALPDDQYEVFEAETKEEALALCRRRSLHCLIADLSTPEDVDFYRQNRVEPSWQFYHRIVTETNGTVGAVMLVPPECKVDRIVDFEIFQPMEAISIPVAPEELLGYMNIVVNHSEHNWDQPRLHPVSALLQKDSLAQELKCIPDAAERVALEITLHPAPDESTLIRIADLLVEARHTVGREGDIVGQLGDDAFLFVTFSDNTDAVTQWVCGQAAQRLGLTLNIQPAALEDVMLRLKT